MNIFERYEEYVNSKAERLGELVNDFLDSVIQATDSIPDEDLEQIFKEAGKNAEEIIWRIKYPETVSFGTIDVKNSNVCEKMNKLQNYYEENYDHNHNGIKNACYLNLAEKIVEICFDLEDGERYEALSEIVSKALEKRFQDEVRLDAPFVVVCHKIK